MSEGQACSHCGEPVRLDWTVCPTCGHRLTTPLRQIRCRVCSRRAARTLHTCPHCGAKLEAKPFPVLKVGFSAVVVLFLAFGAAQWGPLFFDGAERVAQFVNPPSPTPVPTATATHTATSTPSPEPTATNTSTTTPTATMTPVPPTSSPTPSQTPTLAPTRLPTATDTPTLTPTPTPRFDTLELLGPEDGTIFGRQQELILKWEDVGPLGPDEYYAVRLTWRQDGQLAYGGTNVKQNFWRVPANAYWGLADEFTGRKYEWYVYIEEIATDETGQQVGRPVSDVSDTLSFLWQ